ncbi:MAG: hypothetical protein N3D11_10430 [Candidatus Sumerlaeia bacterium]|nr:hypothetical protein [Candidatus Sumerlaeia bacterium]
MNRINHKSICGRRQSLFLCVAILVTIRAGFCADVSALAFRATGDGTFEFETGVLKGRLNGSGKVQSIVSMVHVETGMDLAHGGTFPGLLSYYRMFSAGTRYGDAMRDWPRSARLRPDGVLEIVWPAGPKNPAEVTAIFRWSAADTLDVETLVRPQQDLADFEVFVSSYFNKNLRSFVYTSPTLHIRGKPTFLACDVNPFIAGTYLAFPRDRRAAAIMYDGRWDVPPHPVHLSTGRYFAAPLALKRDAGSGLTVAMMSRPRDCFMILTPYNMEPPDGIAGHYSLYQSLFGYEVKAGQTARALLRLIVGKDLSDASVLQRYETFLKEHGDK